MSRAIQNCAASGFHRFRLGDFIPQDQQTILKCIEAKEPWIRPISAKRGIFQIAPREVASVSPLTPIVFDSSRVSLRELLEVAPRLFYEDRDVLRTSSNAQSTLDTKFQRSAKVLDSVGIENVSDLGVVAQVLRDDRARSLLSPLRAVFVGLEKFVALRAMDGRQEMAAQALRRFPTFARAHQIPFEGSVGTGRLIVLQPVIDPARDIEHIADGSLLRSTSPIVQSITAALYLRRRGATPLTALTLLEHARRSVVMPYLIHGRRHLPHHPVSLLRLGVELQWSHFANDFGSVANALSMRDVFVFGSASYVMPLSAHYVRLTLLPKLDEYCEMSQGSCGVDRAVPLREFFAWLWEEPQRQQLSSPSTSSSLLLKSGLSASRPLQVDDVYPFESIGGVEMVQLHLASLAKYILHFPRLLDLRAERSASGGSTLWIHFKRQSVPAARSTSPSETNVTGGLAFL